MRSSGNSCGKFRDLGPSPRAVSNARIILAYLDDPSPYAVARAIGVTQQTVTRCLERAAELGVIEALDDRPRAGRDPVMTAEEDLAGGIGVSEGQGIGLSPRAVDHPATRRTRSPARTDRRASEPCEAGPGNGLQDPGRARGQAAQEMLWGERRGQGIIVAGNNRRGAPCSSRMT